MPKRILIILLFVFVNAYSDCSYAAQYYLVNTRYLEQFTRNDRVLILAPHPDDEGIGCAGIIQEALFRGAQVKVTYLTNGDYNQLSLIVYEKMPPLIKSDYIHLGKTRMNESIKAMQMLGVSKDNLIFLGYPDFGTFSIFSQHWQGNRPYESMLTHISAVPYKNNLSPGAPYQGESILEDLKKVILDYRPTKIFVSHPADVNGDHKTSYLFLEIALADLRSMIAEPKVYPYLVHLVGWPQPRGYHPDLELQPPKRLMNSSLRWYKFILNKREVESKNKTILSYRSQTSSSASYLLSFARKNELFSDYEDIRIKKSLSVEKRAGYLAKYFDMLGYLGVSDTVRSYDIIGNKSKVSYEIVDNALLVRVGNFSGIKNRFNATLYLFGYSYQKPFAQMPKIRIVAFRDKATVFDKKSVIKAEGVKLEAGSGEFIVNIPLEVLGNPDFILISIKAYGNTSPADAMAFRKIVITE